MPDTADLAADKSSPGGRRASGLRLGVDVGGTFTDLLLLDEKNGRTYMAKVPSTPQDSSVGVLNGIEKICRTAGVDPQNITEVMHGTTVATNTVLTSSGALVGLVTTKGYRDTLQIARSYVPGGLGGWVIWNKRPPLAPLEFTIEADERMDARGNVIVRLDEQAIRRDLEKLLASGIEALTIALFNSYTNDAHERRIAEIAREIAPNIPVSTSAAVMPEMYEYERTETTVVNSYVRPVVSKYVANLQGEIQRRMGGDVNLRILRSDGGLSSAQGAMDQPVNLLMSGPAGGVAGALWIAKQAKIKNLLTFDMGGTSTDVALIQNSVARTRRETRVGDVTVRAPSIDVRTVGAGGGSIAYIPELTKALRVGPQSAGAVPGPAAYKKGGEQPTVTDANVVLGYLPSDAKLGGDMEISRELATQAVGKIAETLSISVEDAAEGIVRIVNENMVGALRLVSVEQGYDPRDFALIGFGGAGPLHANALARIVKSWPAVIPPGPGVLCAYGDATTRLRNEASQTYVTLVRATSDAEIGAKLKELAASAAKELTDEGVSTKEQTVLYQVDIRYKGQGMKLTVDITPADFAAEGLAGVTRRFDAEHEQLFTFALDAEHELVGLRAVVQGAEKSFVNPEAARDGTDASAARTHPTRIYADGAWRDGHIYDRGKLKPGNKVPGPAVVTEMDSTTVILPDHVGVIDDVGNILIWPADHKNAR
ncbi:hydantoinase/oxoprolinase family protein [Mesorhizobium sp. LHD-90]|uniref:hydantoinase/oxoprolinase family protein n=1 Tax=Mesorhizobium sp. LHD-90 TaxID=3071414 RepID=UPI0027E06D26|nr:hydantoinase/oxoprolinase family protein [Mesorhizobium sp. LHD-90]MDQ6437535.1 hydantoinase/oxoprolinase family protein [Mesorhizobium sp. LHD-90]